MSSTVMNKKAPYSMKPEFIIVHNTANDASAHNEITYMNKNNGNIVSFHLAVDDKEVVQGIPFNRNSFNAGDGATGNGNRKGIAIEICYSKSGGARFIEAEKNGAKLTAYLLNQYGWKIDKVKKHQDFSGKYCPHRTLDMGWSRFLKMVEQELNALQKRDYIGKTVKRDVYAKQIEINVKQLIVRNQPKLAGLRQGYANVGIYPLKGKTNADGYIWYQIGSNMYVPHTSNWITELKTEEKPVEPEKPKEPEVIEPPVIDKPNEKEDEIITDDKDGTIDNSFDNSFENEQIEKNIFIELFERILQAILNLIKRR